MRAAQSPDVMDVVRTTLDNQKREYAVPQPDVAMFDAKTPRGTYAVMILAGPQALMCVCMPHKPVLMQRRRLLERWARPERWHTTVSEPKIAFACTRPSPDRFALNAMMNAAKLTPRSLEMMIGWTLQLADTLDARLAREW